MGVKKDIGKALHERLKDLNSSPDDKVWERIQGTLNTKKRNKSTLFWYRSIGLGLLIILFSTIIYTSINGERLRKDSFENIDTSSPSELENTTQESEVKNNKANEILNNNQSRNSNFLNKEDSINNILSNQNNLNAKVNGKYIDLKNKKRSKNSSIKNKTESSKINLISSSSSSSTSGKITTSTNNNNPTYSNEIKNGDNRNGTINKILSNQSSLKTETLLNSTNKKIKLDTSHNKKNQEFLEQDSAIINVDSLITKDSILNKTILKDSILPKKNIEKKIIPKEESFWDVTFYAAPTYYNTLSKGSTFGNNFVDHKKESEITLSYRVTFDIKFSEKLYLRTGFGKVNLSHKTIDVSTTTNTGTIPNLTEFDGISYDFSAIENIYSNDLLEPLNSLNFKQKIGYFEIPAELVYKFPRKKVQWRIVGGGSVLKITNNSIIAESSNGDYNIGKSNNLSEYSFSANFGGGFDYPISKKIKINAEPMFKYHLNTFSRETANFKPYSFSVFIGATYKF